MRAGNDASGRGGFTLVEILIAVAILGFLLVMAASSFRGLDEKYKVEAETKQLYGDLMDVRGRAMQRNRFYFVRIQSNGYNTYEDCNPTPDGNCNWEAGLDNQVTGVTVKHPITATGGTANFAFNRNGIATNTGTIRFSSTAANPDYDCINVQPTRIKMGQWNGATCVEK